MDPQAKEILLGGLDVIIVGSFFDSSLHTTEIVYACIAQYVTSVDVDVIRRINQLIFTWNSRCPSRQLGYLYPVERIGPESFSEQVMLDLFNKYYSSYLVGYYSIRESVSQRLLSNMGVQTAFAIDKQTLRFPRGITLPPRVHTESAGLPPLSPPPSTSTMKLRSRGRSLVGKKNKSVDLPS